MEIEELVFVGFNRRVAALEKRNGEIVWKWKASKGTGDVSLLLEGERLFVAVSGYQYCLDARTGNELWFNPMTGFGFGVTCIATSSGHSSHTLLQQAAARSQAQGSANAGSAGVAGSSF